MTGTRAFVLTIIAVGLLLAGCTAPPKVTDTSSSHSSSSKPKPAGKATTSQANTAAESSSTTLTVYFANDQSDKLLKEVREVDPADKTPKTVIEELIKGPTAPGHNPTIPKGTSLRGVTVSGGIASVDFSSEFEANHPGGSAGEQMTVYSIVNSLTELSGIGRAKFLVNGRALDTIAGHLDLTAPVSRDASLIAE